MRERNSFVFDFDSTLVSVETLDTLIKRNLRTDEDRRKIDDITKRAMNGELDFQTSLSTRLRLARTEKKDFARMAEEIESLLTPGIDDLLNFLRQKKQELFIVSGGFTEIVRPVARRFGIPEENCFANEYTWDSNGVVTGVRDGPLTREGGKSVVLRALREQNRLPGVVVMTGDGMSDWQVCADGLADVFIGCGFIVTRPNVKARSSLFVQTPSELLSLLQN